MERANKNMTTISVEEFENGKLILMMKKGRIDESTLALIGDASNLGGRNREVIYRDEQLISTVKKVSIDIKTKLLTEIRRMKAWMVCQE